LADFHEIGVSSRTGRMLTKEEWFKFWIRISSLWRGYALCGMLSLYRC